MRTKTILIQCSLLLLFLSISFKPASAQKDEAVQLILNVEKLAQLKKILQNMKDGYEILNNGYNAVKDIAEGNFKLHKTFLDGLLAVSPEVRKYHRIAEIIRYQQMILKEYKAAYQGFVASGNFTSDELLYLSQIYQGLFDQSLKNLDELALIITAGELRMSDSERIEAIDRVFEDMQEMLVSLRTVNGKVRMLEQQRERYTNEIQTLKELHQ